MEKEILKTKESSLYIFNEAKTKAKIYWEKLI